MKKNDIVRKNKYLTLMMSTLLLLGGCGSEAMESTKNPESIATENVLAQSLIDETGVMDNEIDGNDFSAEGDYKEALLNSINNTTLPDGTAFPAAFDETIDRFAILDLNHDGQDELILDIESVDTATNGYYIYQNIGNEIKMLEYVPDPVFYNNGIMISQWSKIPPKALDFRPYDLYTYNETQGCYQFVASVDAWNKSVEEDGITGYPEEADISDFGFVYYISDEEGVIDYDAPIDHSDYEAWLAQFDMTEVLEIPFTDFSLEAVNNL